MSKRTTTKIGGITAYHYDVSPAKPEADKWWRGPIPYPAPHIHINDPYAGMDVADMETAALDPAWGKDEKDETVVRPCVILPPDNIAENWWNRFIDWFAGI